MDFDPEFSWDIKPNTATRLCTKAQGWTEERGPTLGIEQASCRYTEGVKQAIQAPTKTTLPLLKRKEGIADQQDA